MLPYITLFGKIIYMYPVMAVIGALAAGIFCCIQAKKKFGENDSMIMLLLIGAVGVILGGHLLYALTNIRYIATVAANPEIISSFGAFVNIAGAVFGGSVFYGGLLGGLAAGSIYIRVKKLDFSEYSDIAACGIPLFHFFGRIGCFLGGCCYGKESEIGFHYESAIIEQLNSTTRFPIQLVEAFVNLLIFAALAFLLNRGFQNGKLLRIYFAVYAAARFIIEFWRGDAYRGFLFGFSTSQIISAAILVVLCVTAALRKLKAVRSSTAGC